MKGGLSVDRPPFFTARNSLFNINHNFALSFLIMKRLGKRILLFILMSIGTWIQANSQEGNPLQYISGLSQSSWNNPSFQNKTEKLVVGIPIIAGAWVDWNANFSPDYIFSKNFTYSFDDFYTKLGERGYELGTVNIPVLYLSLRREKQNFTFAVSERIFTESSFDHEFLKFIDNGLEPYYGKTESYGPMNIHAYHYRELSFSYSKQLRERLSVGVRPKLLFGRMYYEMNDVYINVLTDTDAGELLIKPEGNYQIAGQFEISYSDITQATKIRPVFMFEDYFFGFRNLGAAIDLGISYKTGKTEISAAINDLGFFTMDKTVYNVTYINELRFNGSTLYQSNNNELNNYKEARYALKDMVSSNPYLITAEPSTDKITINIPLKANVSVRQFLPNNMELGVSAQITFSNRNMKSYLSAFGHKALNDRFDLTTSVTLLDFKKLLPGLGASYTGKYAQYYLSTNNITALAKPSSAKYLNLCLGVNFLFSTQ